MLKKLRILLYMIFICILCTGCTKTNTTSDTKQKETVTETHTITKEDIGITKLQEILDYSQELDKYIDNTLLLSNPKENINKKLNSITTSKLYTELTPDLRSALVYDTLLKLEKQKLIQNVTFERGTKTYTYQFQDFSIYKVQIV